MPNRDYFTRPTQAGGRTAHDYGNTTLGEAGNANQPNGVFLFLRWGLPRALCFLATIYACALLMHALAGGF